MWHGFTDKNTGEHKGIWIEVITPRTITCAFAPEAQRWDDAVERIQDTAPLQDDEREAMLTLFMSPVPNRYTPEDEAMLTAQDALFYRKYGDFEKLGLPEEAFRQSLLSCARDHA